MNLQEAKKLENKNILKTHLEPSQTCDNSGNNHENKTKPHNITQKNLSIITGISGGSDSIFLLECLSKAQKTLPNLKIIVAHINHSLRGKDSENDEKFVKSYVENLNNNNNDTHHYINKFNNKIIFCSKKINIKALSKKSRTGTEETARKKRYEYFLQLAKKYKATFLLTAHHADDNLETILLNLSRGATLQGLCGMQILDNIPFSKIFFKASFARADFLLLFRPLLSITKKEITNYLKLKKIPYRTDESNFSNEYNRNIIRNKVLPFLLKINPNLSKTLSKNTESLREISDFLTQKAQNWIRKNILRPGHSLSFPAKPFRTLHSALQKQILLSLYEKLVGNTQNIETVHIEESLALINQNIGNKKKKFGKTLISLKNNIVTIKS